MKYIAVYLPRYFKTKHGGHMKYENVGGDLDKVTGKRCTFAGFPIRWMKGEGSIVRLVAIMDEGDQ